MLRPLAVALVLAALPLASAEAEPRTWFLGPDGEGDALPLGDAAELGTVPLLPDGERSPLVMWRSPEPETLYFDGMANLTLHLDGVAGSRFISLMAQDENGTFRTLAAGQFGQEGPLPAAETHGFDLSGEHLQDEHLVVLLRVGLPSTAAVRTGPDASHLLVNVSSLPIESALPEGEPATGGSGGQGPDGGAAPAAPDEPWRHPPLQAPVYAWALAAAIAAISIAMGARATGRW